MGTPKYFSKPARLKRKAARRFKWAVKKEKKAIVLAARAAALRKLKKLSAAAKKERNAAALTARAKRLKLEARAFSDQALQLTSGAQRVTATSLTRRATDTRAAAALQALSGKQAAKENPNLKLAGLLGRVNVRNGDLAAALKIPEFRQRLLKAMEKEGLGDPERVMASLEKTLASGLSMRQIIDGLKKR